MGDEGAPVKSPPKQRGDEGVNVWELHGAGDPFELEFRVPVCEVGRPESPVVSLA